MRRRASHSVQVVPPKLSSAERRRLWREANPDAPLLDEEIRERLLPEEQKVWDGRNNGYFAGDNMATYFALRLLAERETVGTYVDFYANTEEGE